jgi:hypothetical protein
MAFDFSREDYEKTRNYLKSVGADHKGSVVILANNYDRVPITMSQINFMMSHQNGGKFYFHNGNALHHIDMNACLDIATPEAGEVLVIRAGFDNDAPGYYTCELVSE